MGGAFTVSGRRALLPQRVQVLIRIILWQIPTMPFTSDRTLNPNPHHLLPLLPSAPAGLLCPSTLFRCG